MLAVKLRPKSQCLRMIRLQLKYLFQNELCEDAMPLRRAANCLAKARIEIPWSKPHNGGVVSARFRKSFCVAG